MSTTKLTLYSDDTQAWGLIEADALQTLANLPDSCVDALVTDPPYGIEIAAWDGPAIRQAVHREGERPSDGEAFERWTTRWASECRRVLKPGGHAVIFGSPRVFHRLVSGVEAGGLEVRDQLLWLYATGVPKARRLPGGLATTLKPAYEPILLARAPFTGSATDNLSAWGTGALNIEAARITSSAEPAGFWPANVTLSHSSGCRPGACKPDCPLPRIDVKPVVRRYPEARCSSTPASASLRVCATTRIPR
jgi:hypothetical protein